MTELTVPTAPDELEELLADKAKVEKIMADGRFAELVTNYARAVANKDSDLAAQVREETQRVLAQFMKENNSGTAKVPVDMAPGRSLSPSKGSLYNAKAPGVAVDSLFDDSASFFRAVASQHNSAFSADATETKAKLDQVRRIQNSFGSTVPADGGFLIPETLRSQLLMLALETALVRPRATVIPMESLRVPIPMVDSTSNVSSVFGGIVAYWTEEGAALTESQASFGRVVLEAKKLTAYAEAPNELVADASAFNGFFDAMFPQALAYYEDLAFIAGSGAGEPLGFLNCPAAVVASAVSGQGANTLVWENIVAMYARMLPSSLQRAVWIASPDTFPQLATMALSVGTGGAPIWISDGTQTPRLSLLGRPIYISEKVPALGTTGDLIFADLSYYLVGDRQAMQSMSSPHYKFANDKTAFRIIERVDGRPWMQSAVTPHNNSATLSPFVQLSSTRT